LLLSRRTILQKFFHAVKSGGLEMYFKTAAFLESYKITCPATVFSFPVERAGE